MQAGERCFLSLHKQGQRKNSESPWGIEPQTYEFCTMMLHHRATKTLVSKAHYKVHV